MKSLSVTIQAEATKQYLNVVTFVQLFAYSRISEKSYLVAVPIVLTI